MSADEAGPTGGAGPEDDELLAGEYVLGVLDAEARRDVAARIAAEPAFAELVRRWEERLLPLAEDYAPEPPPEGTFAVIQARLFGGTARQGAQERRAPGRESLWHSLAFWRGLSFASLAALAFAAGLLAMQSLAPPSAPPGAGALLAALEVEGSPTRFLARYSPDSGLVELRPVTVEAAPEGDLELWVIAGDRPPASLGLLDARGRARLDVAPELRGRLREGAVLAISLEPEGGSPTGQPTGPIVAAGPAKRF